jgi:coenzyme F420-reducing hydrogenase gamma subunit
VAVYVQRYIQNASESLVLEALEDIDVAISGCPPQLNAINPDGFDTVLCPFALPGRPDCVG